MLCWRLNWKKCTLLSRSGYYLHTYIWWMRSEKKLFLYFGERTREKERERNKNPSQLCSFREFMFHFSWCFPVAGCFVYVFGCGKNFFPPLTFFFSICLTFNKEIDVPYFHCIQILYGWIWASQMCACSRFYMVNRPENPNAHFILINMWNANVCGSKASCE